MNETELRQLVRRIVTETVRRVLSASLEELLASANLEGSVNFSGDREPAPVAEAPRNRTADPAIISERHGSAAAGRLPVLGKGENLLITEEDVRRMALSGQRVFSISRGTIVTPLARDTANELGIQFNVMEVN